VSREIVNQALSALRRQGVVDVAGGRVIIRNPEALARAAS
jgi:CRP-like cAMP-binding protein